MPRERIRWLAAPSNWFAVIVLCGVGLAYYIVAPFVEVKSRQVRFEAIERGMRRSEVIDVLGKPDSEGAPRSPDNVWITGKGPLATSAIRYHTETFFLPVTFEVAFDLDDRVVLKHRFD